MARDRLTTVHQNGGGGESGGFGPGELPIAGHVPELFDAEPPYLPRGAPAQAWSVACFVEAQVRRRMRADAKLTRILAQRWMDRKERRPRVRKELDLG
jgi:glycogen debranching enzyme